jgi:hypothetical protein
MEIKAFDLTTSWLDWGFNDIRNANPIEIMKSGNRLSSFFYSPKKGCRLNSKKAKPLKDQLFASTQSLIERACGRTISLLISGRDSELIAYCLHSLGARFELWHAHFTFAQSPNQEGNGSPVADVVHEISHTYNAPLFIKEITRDVFYDAALQFGFDTGISEPALGGLTSLINQIPVDNFVVLGDGDVAKNPNRYQSIYNKNRYSAHALQVKERGATDLVLPFIPDEVMYKIWASEKNRFGDFCFYQSDLNLIGSFLLHPDLLYNRATGAIDLSEVYKKEFPQLKFKNKTDLFKHPEKGRLKLLIRTELAKKYGDCFNDQELGTCWTINSIFEDLSIF